MKEIDLDKIINEKKSEYKIYGGSGKMTEYQKDCMKEAIRQALEIASENAGVDYMADKDTGMFVSVNKETITSIVNRVK
jgi:hypothetical protein